MDRGSREQLVPTPARVASAIGLCRVELSAHEPVIIALLDQTLPEPGPSAPLPVLPTLSGLDDAGAESCRDSSHASVMARILVAMLTQATGSFRLGILPIGVCCADRCERSAIERGLVLASQRGVHVALLSLSGMPSDTVMGDEELSGVAQLLARGVPVVASVANSPIYSHSFPACCRGVMPVAACDLDGRRHRDSAYCADVVRRGVSAPGRLELGDVGRPELVAGTSVAAAIAAAAVAVVRVLRPRWSGARIRHALWRSGRRSPNGAGMLDVSAALTHG